ncbi:MAG: roadblock/LC7 domain-containing protein [Ardenticatenales bacterium]|nr:roadblock/LC7 domain-containing protein [Ardenticatenales bacterium]
MIEFRVDQLEKLLKELRRLTPSVIGSIILSSEGLPIAADLPSSFGEERIAARSASMLALGERIAAELRRGGLDQIFISGSDGYVVVALINEVAALTVLYSANARVAMAILDVHYSVEQLRRVLG